MSKNKNSYLLSWQAQKFENFERHPWWGISLFIILIILLIYSLLTDNFLLSIILILSGIIIYLFEKKDPETYHFALCETGIIAHDRFYEFLDIENFWIFYEPPHTRIISLHMKGYLRPYLHIPLHQIDPVIVHEKLVEFIPEERQEQNLVDVLERLLHM